MSACKDRTAAPAATGLALTWWLVAWVKEPEDAPEPWRVGYVEGNVAHDKEVQHSRVNGHLLIRGYSDSLCLAVQSRLNAIPCMLAKD